jgi:transcriptional regulator NrdR family protein
MSGQFFRRRVAPVEEVLTCAHAHQEYHKSMLVKRTSSVNRPLTCYRCQQGFTTSLEIGNIHHLLHILLYTVKKIDR